MSNEYKQGVDRVAVDESFPYPIKLEYDNTNIYLTPIMIPSNIEMLGLPRPSKQYDGTSTYLCLEVSISNRNHQNGGRDKVPSKKHPCKGGKFRILGYPNYNRSTYCFIDPVVGDTYTVPISNSFFSRIGCSPKEGGEDYVYVRGCYRIGRDVDFVTRTKYHSNVAKIYYRQS